MESENDTLLNARVFLAELLDQFPGCLFGFGLYM